MLGENKGTPVITVSGAQTRKTSGQLRMTTIVATGPDARISLGDVLGNWFRTDRAVMPRDAVYPSGDTVREIEKHNLAQMRQSQDAATQAALTYLGLKPGQVEVDLKPRRRGRAQRGAAVHPGDHRQAGRRRQRRRPHGGRTIAGTGTIDASGKVGAVGGVALKTQAARRDGATVFLVPKAECADAKAELPKGLRLVPVTTLKGAVDPLVALEKGKGTVPSC